MASGKCYPASSKMIRVVGEANGTTDFNNFPKNTISWANNTGVGGYQNAPGNSAYHIITVGVLASHGFQIAIGYSSGGFFFRTFDAYTNWYPWKRLTIT